MKVVYINTSIGQQYNYHSDALLIWAENIPVDQHNNTKLAVIPKPMLPYHRSISQQCQ